MEGYKKDMVFQLPESLVPCHSFSPDTLVRAQFHAAYPSIQAAFWLPLSFPSMSQLPLGVFIWLLLTYAASHLLFPPWPTVFQHRLLVHCQLFQRHENHCPCPLKKDFSQCFTTSVLVTVSPSSTCSISSYAKLFSSSWSMLYSVTLLCWNPADLLNSSFLLTRSLLLRIFLLLSFSFSHLLFSQCSVSPSSNWISSKLKKLNHKCSIAWFSILLSSRRLVGRGSLASFPKVLLDVFHQILMFWDGYSCLLLQQLKPRCEEESSLPVETQRSRCFSPQRD